jgi:hypothetical protein
MIGGVVSAIGSIAAANAQAAGLKSEAQWKEREAAVANIETSVEIANRRREAELMLGSQTAQFAGAGIDVSSGTPMDVGAATVQESEMDVQKARMQGDEKKLKALAEADNLRRQAKAAKQAGMFSAFSSVIGGASGLVGSSSGTSLVSGAFAANPVAPRHLAPPINVSGGGMVNQPVNRLAFGGPR